MKIFKVKLEIRAECESDAIELLQDYNLPNSFSTYSYWQSEEDLNNYRNSEIFNDVWARTKVLFSEKPIAFSLKQHTLVE